MAAQAAAAVVAIVANDWNPWLGFSGGRGVGQAIGALAALTPVGLVVFVIVALAGVMLRAVPQFVALGLVLTPLAAIVAGDSRWTAIACCAIVIVVVTKRLLGNGRPDRAASPGHVYMYRLLYDRDLRDRNAWVRRHIDGDDDASGAAMRPA